MNPCKFKVSLCTLIFACSCSLLACGSDNSSGISASQKAQKPAAKQKTQVMELLVNSPHGKSGTIKPGTSRGMGAQNIEILPPGKAGESGISQQEIEAAIRASKQVDPQSGEVIPPSKRGESGLTQRQVDALKPAPVAVDPQSMEVIPPSKRGERGLTQQQVDALKPAPVAVDPQSTEVIPPSKRGERGLTMQEISAIKARQTKSAGGTPPPPMPPTPK